MCHVHFIRAVIRKIPRKHFKEVAVLLKESLSDSRKLQECALELEARRYPKAADTVDRFIHGLFNYRSVPRKHWRRIRTTNFLDG
jgi:transposase-like protein